MIIAMIAIISIMIISYSVFVINDYNSLLLSSLMMVLMDNDDYD